MSVTCVGELSVSSVMPNVAAFAAKVQAFITSYTAFKASLDTVIDALVTVEGGLDFALNASFGLSALKLSAMLEFQGALRAQASLAVAISNPLAQASAAITAMAASMASLKASMALGLPTISAELGMQLSAIAAVAAAASAKMAGIQAVIDASMSVLAPLVNAKQLIARIRTSLEASIAALLPLGLEIVAHLGNAAAGVRLYVADSTAASLGVELQSALDTLKTKLPSNPQVKALLLVVDTTTHPAVWGDLSFMLRTTP